MKNLSPKIFIVEDDNFYAELIRTTLANDSFENVHHFSSGEDCLYHLNQQPDIIILDHMLGSMSGIHVLKEIKRISPSVQVIFLSAQNEMSVAINALKFGAFDYIEKTHQSAMIRLLLMIEKTEELRTSLPQENRLESIKKWFLIH